MMPKLIKILIFWYPKARINSQSRSQAPVITNKAGKQPAAGCNAALRITNKAAKQPAAGVVGWRGGAGGGGREALPAKLVPSQQLSYI